MATYFSRNATDVQSADSMQTLYLMNSSYFGFPENALPGNVVLINQHAGYQFPGGHQQFMGIPLPAPSAHSFMGNQMSDMNVGLMSSNLMHNNPQWRNARGELSFVQPIGQASPTATNSTGSRCQIPAIENSSGGHHPIPEILQQHGQPRQGGLSLSLSYTSPGFMAASNSLPSDAITAAIVAPGGEGLAVKSDGGGNDEGKVKWEGGLQSVLLGSKYLKAAQELLDEVVNGGKGLKVEISTGKLPERDEKSKREWAPTSSEYPPATKKGGELTATERQELQMKKAKLITMLDEVNRRYKQYRHRMQAAVSSFEDAVGAGAAKTYTELALQTISKQFWCLCDAISGQIRLTSRNLGEEVDCYIIGSGKVEGSSLPQSVNRQQLTQQRPMHQPNAWRPRRGLPERAVSVLRAWLFEHFLHPYPKDADKEMLAKQTGLTRGQVSNWFINARVRLWKPMVEAMYMEETKAQENENNSDDKTCNLSEINEADAAAAMKPTETDSPGQKMNKTNSNQMEYTPTEPLASPPSISAATAAMSSLGDLRRSADGSGLIGSSSPDAHCLDNESVLKQATAKRMCSSKTWLLFRPVDDDVKPDPGMNFVGMIGIGDRQNEHGLAFSNGFRS